MRAKMIRDRRKSSLAVESSVDIHGADVASDLETLFADQLNEGEAMPSFLIVMHLLKRQLAAARQHLVATAARHLEQVDGDTKARNRRDELNARLETKGRRLRDVLDGLHGDGGSKQIAGLDRRTAQEPVALLAQTERIIERFSTLGAAAGEPELAGFTMDPDAVVADLEPDYKALSEIVQELTRQKRRFDATLIAKDEAQEEYDRIFRAVASTLAAFYILAGHDELARRVIPSTRRAGRTQADVPDEERGGQPESPDSDEPSEAAISEAAG